MTPNLYIKTKLICLCSGRYHCCISDKSFTFYNYLLGVFLAVRV